MGRRMLRYLGNNALGAVALFVALGGVSYAATGGFVSGGKLQACVGESGSITLLKGGKHCKRGQKQIAWNQTGPQGAAGAKGAPGITGAPGTTGAPGPTGASGQASNVMWAKLNASGELEGSQGVTSGKLTGAGSYEVVFEKPTTNCAVVASQNNGSIGHFVSEVFNSANRTLVFVINRADGAQALEAVSVVAVC